MGSQQRQLSWVVPESATRQSQAEISKSTQPAEAEVSHVNGILGEQIYTPQASCETPAETGPECITADTTGAYKTTEVKWFDKLF